MQKKKKKVKGAARWENRGVNRITGVSPLNSLYLGTFGIAKTKKFLVAANVKLVVNVAATDWVVSQCNTTYERLYEELGIVTIRLAWDDAPEFADELFANSDEATDAIERIAAQLSAGTSVLVHCRQGKSRSGTLMVAYLCKTMGMLVDEALLHVQARRPVVHPNEGFVKWLHAYV